MSNKVKEIDVKNQTYYFIDDVIYIKNFNPTNFRIDEKSYKNILYLLHLICDNQRFKTCKN